jgi:hypothetical protein
MKRQLTQLERLDTAARAEVAEASFYVYRWVFSAFAVIGVLLATISQAPFYETLYVRVFAAVGTLAAMSMWLRWRYAFHTGGLFFLALSAGGPMLNWQQHPLSILGWIEQVGFAGLYAYFGYCLLSRGVPFAAVSHPGWEKERALVQMWLKRLTNLATESQVFEIATGSFWTGYYTYRLMRSDGFWQVVTLKTGNYLRPRAYRILDADAVKMVKLPNGRFYLQIGKRTLREVNIAPEMQTGLLSLTGAK